MADFDFSDLLGENENQLLIEDKKHKNFISLELCDFILSFFLFAPAAILFWATTWDLFYYYVYSNNLLLSATLTLCVGLTIHLIMYTFQYKFQNYHDKKYGTSSQNWSNFYPKGYVFRFIYTYICAFAYVAQWRGIWDIYDYFIDEIHPIYGFFISICGLSMNCFVLKRSLYSFTTTVPYILNYDIELDSYFLKDKQIVYENVSFVILLKALF